MFDKNFHDPEITLVGKCHTCNEQILYGLEFCPKCGIKIVHEDMEISVVNNFLLTQAVSSANSIRTLNVGVHFFLGTSILRFLIDYSFWFDVVTSLTWFIPLFVIMRWFLRHGRWESNDVEYLTSRKEMKKSFWLWLAAHAVNCLLIGMDGWDRIE